MKRVTNTNLLRTVEESIPTAIKKIVDVLNSSHSKHSEILNAAEKLIKYRFQFQEALRKEALDKIEIEYKQLNLEEKRIKLEALRGVVTPDATPDQVRTYSRVFTPAMKPEDANTQILETG